MMVLNADCGYWVRFGFEPSLIDDGGGVSVTGDGAIGEPVTDFVSGAFGIGGGSSQGMTNSSREGRSST